MAKETIEEKLDYWRSKGIEIFERMPEGWAVLEGATTAPIGYMWIWNCKSRFGGGFRHALMKCPE